MRTLRYAPTTIYIYNVYIPSNRKKPATTSHILHVECQAMIKPLIKLSTRQLAPTARSIYLGTMSFSCFPWSKKQTTTASRTYSTDHARFNPDPPAYTEKPRSRNVDKMSSVTKRGFTRTAHKEEVKTFKLGLPIEEAESRLTKLQALLVEHKLDY